MSTYAVPYTGQQVEEYLAKARDFAGVPIGDGIYSAGKIYTALNQYLVDNGGLYKVKDSVTLPYAVNVALYPSASSDPSLLPYENFELDQLAAVARSLNVTGSQVIYATDITTPLDNILYIYDGVAEVTYNKPVTATTIGEKIVSLVGTLLTTTVTTYVLNKTESYIVNPNMLQNSHFRQPSPDPLITPPSATPEVYNAGDQVFLNYFVSAGGATLTQDPVTKLVNVTAGSIYQDVPKTDSLEQYNGPLVASWGDSAGASTEDASVGFTDETTHYRITLAPSNVFSCKFEQGVVASRHETLNLFDIYGHPDVTNSAIVESFGATGLGEPYDDTNSILDALAVAKSRGVPLIFNGGATYFLGTFPDLSELSKFVIDYPNANIVTNNCKFTANASIDPFHDGKASQVIFDIIDAPDCTIGDYSVEADQIARTGSDRQGIHAMVARSLAVNFDNLNIGTVTGDKLVSTLTVISSDPDNLRLRGINFKKLTNNSGYYALNCAENGDSVTGDIQCNDCIRSYFVYGVKGHTVTINHTNHLKFSDVVIARLARDTSGINITNYTSNTITSSGLISLEHLNDDANSKISNITVNFDCTVSNPGNPTINFKSFTAAGAAETQTTKMYDDIRLKGKTNSTTPIDLATEIIGGNVSRVYLERDELLNITDTKRFNFIVGAKRVAFSDTGASLLSKFNVADLIFTPSWGKLTIWGTDDAFSASGEYIMREVFIYFSVNSNGAVSVLSTQTNSDWIVGALAPAITYPAAAIGEFDLNVQINNYTGTNRRAKVTLELLTGIYPL